MSTFPSFVIQASGIIHRCQPSGVIDQNVKFDVSAAARSIDLQLIQRAVTYFNSDANHTSVSSISTLVRAYTDYIATLNQIQQSRPVRTPGTTMLVDNTNNTWQDTSASFVQLHQFNDRLNLQYNADGSANFIDGLHGFKELFDPTGTIGGGKPACVLGVPAFSSQCKLVKESIGALILGTTDSYTQYKFYFPAGQTELGMFSAMPQDAKYAVAVRLGVPPNRTTPLSDDEYAAAKQNMDINTAFNRLLAGQEIIMVHDGGGTINPTGNGRYTTNPTLKGYWVYVRVLNNTFVTNLSGATGLDLEMYTTWYNSMIASDGFNSTGDPKDVMVPPVRPVGIKLSKTSTTRGTTVSILPTNDSASILGRCSVSPPDQGVSINRYNISIASDAAPGQYTISCGDATEYVSQYAQYEEKFTTTLTVT